jgi:hypothetical protein
MKYQTKRFKSLAVALKELERFIRDGEHLQTGKPFERFDGLRSRELLGNWLLCVAFNFHHNADRMTFTSDPLGGDGIIYDETTKETWPTEHVLTPVDRGDKPPDLEALILKAIEEKQAKGGAAYAKGKTLVVFLNAGGGGAWFPNRVAKRLPAKLDFGAVWVVGLHRVEEGQYVYGVTLLDASEGDAPAWLVRIGKDFDTWEVSRL